MPKIPPLPPLDPEINICLLGTFKSKASFSRSFPPCCILGKTKVAEIIIAEVPPPPSFFACREEAAVVPFRTHLKCLRCNLEKNRSLEAGPLPLSSAELTDDADKKGRESKVGRTSLARKNNFKVCCFPRQPSRNSPSRPPALYFLPFLFTVFFFCGTVWRIFRVVGQVCTAVQTPREDKRNERIKA